MKTAAVLRWLRRLPPLETVVLIVALCVLVTIAVAGRRSKTSVPLDSYSSYDTASGGYRAFAELLAREGVRVERFEQVPAFLGTDVDTLVWAEPLAFDPRARATSGADIAALESWVLAGGRLSYVGFDDAAATRGILALPRSRLAAAKSGAAYFAPSLAGAGVSRLHVSAPRRYRAGRRGERVLFDDGRGPVAVAYRFGRGTVTAVIDETLFANGTLARGDAARLAVAFASPGRAGGVVSFDETVHGHAVPERWWQIVPRPFAVALAVALGALLVAFAGAAIRLGPPLAPETRDDRTTADFIDALGSLLARGKAVRYVMESATRSTARTIARALRLREDASDDEIAASIPDDAARSAFTKLLAIANDAPANDENLVRGVALAQRLRKDFAAHGRSRY